MSARCLVTGVAGFIGSHLAERLLAEGHEVVGIDRFSDYYPRATKQANLQPLLTSPRFRLVEASLCSCDLHPLLEGVEVVFHEAAQPGVRASWGQTFQTYSEDNILATQRLLEACKGGQVRRFVYASSSSVYGDATDLPVTEKTMTRPVSPYGVTKLAAEHLCYLYRANFGVPTVALRYFTVYGPRQRPDMGFHRFIEAIRVGKTIQIYGDGQQTRDSTFVTDAVEANLLVLNAPASAEFVRDRGISGWRVWNIGGGSRSSVNQIIALLERILGCKAVVKHVDAQHGDARHTWADVSSAHRELGFVPRTTLEEGLRAQVEWQMRHGASSSGSAS